MAELQDVPTDDASITGRAWRLTGDQQAIEAAPGARWCPLTGGPLDGWLIEIRLHPTQEQVLAALFSDEPAGVDIAIDCLPLEGPGAGQRQVAVYRLQLAIPNDPAYGGIGFTGRHVHSKPVDRG